MLSAQKRMLVADDEEGIRRLVARLVRVKAAQLGGLEVVPASSAEEALTILERERFDVVLTDFRMGGKTGEELLAVVSARWPATAGMLMTGYPEVAESAAKKCVPGRTVIQKPWSNDAFVATLRRLLTQ